LGRTDANGSTYYHADGSGNVTALIDSQQTMAARYMYSAFGGQVGKWGTLADANVMQFSSMPRHANSGLSLYLFRAYDSSLQRWTQPDPIGEWGGINLYGFVGNSPLCIVDLFGLDSMVPGINGTQNNSVPALTLNGPIGGPISSSYPPADSFLVLGGMYAGSGLMGPAIMNVGSAAGWDYGALWAAQLLKMMANVLSDCPPNRWPSLTGAKNGYRAVSDAELKDIAEKGFRPHPEGRSMQDKWFSETPKGAEQFRDKFPDLKHVVEAEVPESVYDESYRHPNIDGTGPGFAIPPELLPFVKPK
jgi:RHS repeat-associated protein